MVVANKPLVSIISPCYNGEKWVGRMLDSILAQTYKNIEMICIDDGSTDNTETVINSYTEMFSQKGMMLIYAKQHHNGQAAAVNAGLKLVNGEYLSWIDSDDFLTVNSVEKKIKVLRQNSEFGIVTSNFNIVEEKSIDKIVSIGGNRLGNLNYQPFQFYLALSEMSIIESNCFDAVFPNRQIVDCIEGQNFQLMLPLYYRFKRLYIDEPLAYYVIRANSHYHRERSAEELYNRKLRLTKMLNKVLCNLGLTEFEVNRCLKMSTFTINGGTICLK